MMQRHAVFFMFLLGLMALSILSDAAEANVSFSQTTEIPSHEPVQVSAGMHWIDMLVIAGYFGGMLLIGWYYSHKTKDTEDYLLGGRNMKSWMVGLSLFATLLSTVSYFSTPGEIIRHGPMIVIGGLMAVPFVAYVVGWLLIPYIMKLRITSANELLEMRFGLSVRLLAAVFFMALRLMWMSMVIYITVNIALGPVLRVRQEYLPLVSALLGIIVVIYTSSGGLKAVVLTDVIQTFILFLGAGLTIILITIHFKGFSWFPTEWAPTWDPPKFWFDPSVRTTIASAVLTGFTWNVCTAGSDQMALQRFLSTPSLKAARSAYITNLITVWTIQLLLILMGFALLRFFFTQPHYLPGGMDVRAYADKIFPLFITNHLPIGITGLVLSALLAAAMSSLSSGINSACLVISIDFFDRLGKMPANEKAHLRRTQIVSWCIGAVVVLLSFVVGRVPGNITEMVHKVVNLMVAPLFVLFFMAYFVPWANSTGVWAGAVVSVATAVGIAFFGLLGLSFLWIQPSSLVTGIVTASLVSLIAGKKDDAH
ncbi:sodium/solute symporter [candidate division KSB1 bacterium]|nr:sodium/solute symporter [candidate division KSB1 bacterium]